MAKKPQNSESESTSFDFSRYIDMDEDSSELDNTKNADGFDHRIIPHSREEMTTGGLDNDLSAALETYIKAEKVSWNEKRSLRKLAAENRKLEEEIETLERSIFSKAKEYHDLVSSLMSGSAFGGVLTFEGESYDQHEAEEPDDSEETQQTKEKSNELFIEIEGLESKRQELNLKRHSLLTSIIQGASKSESSSRVLVSVAVDERLQGIADLQNITRTKFSEDEEEDFEQGIADLEDYIHGDLGPLEGNEEDADMLLDYMDNDREISAMNRANQEQSDSTMSFEDLFSSAASRGRKPAVETPTPKLKVQQKQEESAIEEADRLAAEVELSTVDDGSHGFASNEISEAIAAVPEDFYDEEEPLEDDLSDAQPVIDDAVEELEKAPEIPSWALGAHRPTFGDSEVTAEVFSIEDETSETSDELSTEAESPEEELISPVGENEEDPNPEDESQDDEVAPEGSLIDEAFEELEADEEAEEPYSEPELEEDESPLEDEEDSSFEEFATVRTIEEDHEHRELPRALIFDALKAKLSMSFEGVPGLED